MAHTYNLDLSSSNLMKLADALRIIENAPKDARPYRVSLLNGATPEPFSSFLAAHLLQRMPGCSVNVKTGRFGDVAGNLARYLEREEEPGVLVLEWADLDARLGMRETGRWGREVVADILESVRLRLSHLTSLLEKHSAGNLLMIAGPTLTLPPVMQVPGWQMSPLETGLQSMMSSFLAGIGGIARVRVLSPRGWDHVPARERLDLKSWWLSGSPYRRTFASLLAENVARAISAPVRLKGIVTDLDNTLWSGILGEVGSKEVHWDLEHHAALHGVYQQFLQSLAEEGILLAIASKNDKPLVEEALSRSDLKLSPKSVFPVEAHWQPKAESLARILAAWNIAPDSVVFLDDSPLEIASVRAAFPTMDCRVFPAENPDEFWSLLEDLADRFGQAERREEDLLRLSSLREGAERAQVRESGGGEEELLRNSEAELTITRIQNPPDPRALELINKTNQFNLNGKRYSEADWLQYLRAGGMCWVASYRDKFGALGKIAVLTGRKHGTRLEVDTWVMSCRAFSRRIEFAMLDFLFQEESASEVVLHFKATERNTPLREFIEVLGVEESPEMKITPETFAAVRPELYAAVLVNQ